MDTTDYLGFGLFLAFGLWWIFFPQSVIRFYQWFHRGAVKMPNKSGVRLSGVVWVLLVSAIILTGFGRTWRIVFVGHYPDLIVAILAVAVIVMSYCLRYFIDADAVKKDDLPRLVGGMWIPMRLLTPAGRRLRLARDIAVVLVVVLAIVLVNVPYRK